jgi:nucleotide-binding universal stress UspA family protein
MSAQTEPTAGAETTIFRRVLVGVDGSPEAAEAVRQAGILAEGEVTLLAAYSFPAAVVPPAGVAVPDPPEVQEEDERRAREAVEDARRLIEGEVEAKVVQSSARQALLREAEAEQATLVAVGSHGVGRMAGILVGSTTTEVVHKAPCSVLVAREAEKAFPRRIVVGVDGSDESARAYEAAQHLAKRFGAELWPVVAYGGEPVDREAVDRIIGHRREELQGKPDDALVAAAADADLLVVGSRGMTGLKALGSVSERVAHEARSSVLVVRERRYPNVNA